MVKSKTMWFGALLTVLGALQGLDWATLITNPKVSGIIISGIGVAVMILRAVTNQPLSDK
jgi:hypothetical protein